MRIQYWVLCLVFLLNSCSTAFVDRHPARDQRRVELLTTFQHLYPQLNNEQIEKKIAAASSPFQFYRSFIPLFYFYLAEDASLNVSLTKWQDHRGWCVGDAHIENFGIIYFAGEEARFTVNDLDDGAPCPLMLDYLRFLTGVLLFDDDFDLERVHRMYVSTLEGEEVKLSTPVQGLLDKSNDRATEIKKKQLVSKSRLQRESGSLDLSKKFKDEVVSKLKFFLETDLQLLDSYRYVRDRGGSFGGERIRVLVELKNAQGSEGEALQVFEIKEMKFLPGVFPVQTASEKVLSTQARIEKSMGLLFGKNSRKTLHGYAQMDGRDFLIRPLWSGNQGISPEDFSDDDLEKVIRDQAETLGAFHRLSSDSRRSYLAAVKKIPLSEWKRTALDVSKKLQRSYRVLQK